MNRWKSLFLLITILLIAAILISCGQTQTTTTTTSTTSTTQALIQGPDVGTSPNDNDQVFRSLAVSYLSPEVVFVGSEGNGIFKSVDGGANWSWIREGLLISANSYPEIYQIITHPDNNDIVYAATVPGAVTSGVYKSTDGGATWTRKISGFPADHMTRSIALDPSSPDVIYAGLSYDADIPGSVGGIYKTSNSAESWSSCNLASPAAENNFTKIAVWDSNNVYVLGWNSANTAEAVGVLKSTDQGTTWTALGNLPDLHIQSFDVAPQDKNVIYVGGSDAPTTYKTTDEGSSWSSISFFGPKAIEISPANSNLVLISHTNKLYRSTDGMETWTAVITAEVEATGITNISDIVYAPSNPSIIYAAADGLRVYKSINSGESFTQVVDLRDFISNY